MISAITLQAGLGFSVLTAGMTSLPWPIAIIVFSGIGLALVARMGRNLLSLGAVMMVAGMVALMWAASSKGPGLDALDLAPGLALAGIGMAFIAPTLMDLVLSGASDRDAGAISGALNTALQVGTALGIALLGLVFFARLDGNSADQAEAFRSEVRATAVAAGTPVSAADQLSTAFGECFDARFSHADPTEQPPSCARASSLAGDDQQQAISALLDHHRASAYTRSFAESLWYGVGVFGASVALIGFLPRRMGERGVPPR